MKILDKYLLKLFISTFTTVFVILFFIFILQTVWLFIAELAGKDLDFISVIKFLLFAMPRVVPLVLPLSVLLASIMTYGSLAENYEFAAMKSSGISLGRAMKYLTAFILFLSVVAFIFANNVIPYAEYKFINFRRNIAQVKPAMAIAEGQFSEVGTYTIKVEKKSGDEGRYLDKVTIHKKTNYSTGSSTIIKAKKGELISSENSNVLKLVLKDGHYYEDIVPKKYEERNKVPFAKSDFQKYVINIDLSKLNNVKLDEEQITNTNTMLTVGELNYTLDSLSKNYNKDLVSYVDNISERTGIVTSKPTVGVPNIAIDTINVSNKFQNNTLLSNFNKSEKEQILKVASGSIETNNFSIESSKYEFEGKVKNINLHWIALYDKFVIGFSCILMFFIGAPLGAIIRKGGLGLPIVFAVMIFIIFHFVNTFGKKLAQENGITPFLGCWMSTIILLPLAIFLTKRATNDKGVSVDFDWFTNSVAFVTNLFKSKTVALQGNEANSEIKTVLAKTDTIKKEEKAIDIIFISEIAKQYNKLSLFALFVNILLLILFFIDKENTVMLIAKAILTLTLLVLIYISQTKFDSLLNLTNQKNNINKYIVLLAGFPFYILFFFYNKAFTKNSQTALQHNN